MFNNEEVSAIFLLGQLSKSQANKDDNIHKSGDLKWKCTFTFVRVPELKKQNIMSKSAQNCK